jgi:phosphohistidine phosphatase SixA
MAALTAARSKSRLGDFYRNLVERGKRKIVAITALMRKIIVIANAKIRDMKLQQQS